MTAAIDRSTILDKLYGATLSPSGWLDVLETLADQMGGTSAWLSHLNAYDGTGSGLATRLDPDYENDYHNYYHHLNPYGKVKNPESYLRTWRPTILSDADRLPRDELLKSEYYNDFMKPQDANSVLFIRLAKDGPSVSVININRSQNRDPFSAADKAQLLDLQQHLIRAHQITNTLAAAHTATSSLLETMHGLPTALFILKGGRIRYVNNAAEALLMQQADLKVVGGYLMATNSPINRRLEALIGIAGSHDPALRQGGTISIPLAHSLTPLSLSISPMRSAEADVFADGASVLVCVSAASITRTTATAMPLSRRELECMNLIAQGKSDLEISVVMGVSHTTVITHVQNAKRKLNAKSRAQAIARCFAEKLL